MSDLIVIFLLFLIIGFSLKQVIADSKKKGCSGCGCCASCGGSCAAEDTCEAEISGGKRANNIGG